MTAITAFQLAMALETENILLNRKVTEAGVRAVFDVPSRGTYYVAEYSGEVVASLLITPEWSDWRNRYILWIQSVYVLPGYREKGVFKSLYAYILGLVQNDPTLGGLRLYVDRSNLTAQQVYTRLGMNGDHYQVFEWMKP